MVRVVKNNGSPYYDCYVGEVGVVAEEVEPGEFKLEDMVSPGGLDLVFTHDELKLIDDEIDLLVKESMELKLEKELIN